MGTRADFYVGLGAEAKWIGSVAWDGYEWEEDPTSALMQSETEADFLAAVQAIAKAREDWTSPSDGWPWPWENSQTTDRAYCFDRGAVHVFVFGEDAEGNTQEFPDMTDVQNVTMGARSGIMIFRAD